MAEFIHQPSGAAGEIAPELYGRVDQELYYIGMKTVRNWIVRQYGGWSNRPGYYYIAEVKNSSHNTRVIKFQFNEEQTYVLELGDQYMRIIADGGQVIETAKNITAITQANPGVITSNAHGFSNGDDVFTDSITGMIELNGRTFRVAGVTANTFQLNDYQGNAIDTSAYTAYSSGGTVSRIYTVSTPWAHEDVFDLNFAQKNDTITIVHPDYYPRDITRTGNTAWTVTEFANENGPFQETNTTATTVYASAATGSGVTLTASAALFDATMVGELFYIEAEPVDDTKMWEAAKAISTNDIRRAGTHYYEAQNTATSGTIKPDHVEGERTDGDNGVRWKYLHSGFGIVEITGYTSTTVVTVTVINRLPAKVVGGANATTLWAKAAWSESEGYPSACVYHKGRMIFGGTNNQPSTLWMSEVDLRFNFGTGNPILDDEAITVPINAVELNAIRHLLPFTGLIVLTSNSEQLISGDSDGALLASSPPKPTPQGSTGSSKVPPIIIGNTGLFVQDIGSTIHSLKYQLDSDSFGGIDMTARSPHLFRNKAVKDWAYQRYPLSVVWAVMDDGELNGLTFMEEQKVFAWHRHDTDGSYHSVATIREGRETSAYFVIEREIDGVTKKYIELQASRYFTDEVDQFFVDCGLTYDGRNTGSTTVTVTGGTTWASEDAEDLTITSSVGIFKAEDATLRNQIVFWNGDTRIPLEITAYTSSTIVTAIAIKDVPVAYRGVARTDWEFAKKKFYNLNHIEAKDVSVLADGNKVPNISVSNGQAVIPDAAAVVHIGLPYTCDLETLEFAGPQGSTKAKVVAVPAVHITVQETQSISIGVNDFASCKPQHVRYTETSMDRPVTARTGLVSATTNTTWSRNGRVVVRHEEPTAISINCFSPEVVLGEN